MHTFFKKHTVLRGAFLAIFLASVTLFGLSLVRSKSYAADASNGQFTVQTIPGPTIAEKLSVRAKGSWPWYLARASGMVAAVTLVVLMLSGIGQVTGYTFRFLDPLTSWASHRALGIAFSISVLVHIFSLLFDHFVTFNILQLFIPWLSSYKPVVLWGLHLGSLYVALGVLAFYLTVIITLSSLVWVEKKPYIWKWLHLLSYITIFFVFIHALYLGTDVAHGIWRLLWVIAALAIGIASLQRLWRAKTA